MEIGARAGRQPGRGYVDETEAQWELLTEALGPFEREIERLARLGFCEAAASFAHGVLAGLRDVGEIAEEDTLIGWGELEDHVAELPVSIHDCGRTVDVDITEGGS